MKYSVLLFICLACVTGNDSKRIIPFEEYPHQEKGARPNQVKFVTLEQVHLFLLEKDMVPKPNFAGVGSLEGLSYEQVMQRLGNSKALYMITFRDVFAYLKAKNLRPATIGELRELQQSGFEFRMSQKIVALGSVKNGQAPFYERVPSGPYYGRYFLADGFEHDCLFPVVDY